MKYDEALECAILHFFSQCRKSYFGDQAHKASAAFNVLSEKCQLNDAAAAVNMILEKVALNLQTRSNSNMVISRSLRLLNEFSTGYSSIKLLSRSSSSKLFLTQHHQLVEIIDLKQRLDFYNTMGRLLFSDDSLNIREFTAFMAPFGIEVERLASISTQSSVKIELIRRLSRDCRGICSALVTRKAYTYFFEWLYPSTWTCWYTLIDFFSAPRNDHSNATCLPTRPRSLNFNIQAAC